MTRRLVFFLFVVGAACLALWWWPRPRPTDPATEVAVATGYRLAIATGKARRGLAPAMQATDTATTAAQDASADVDTAQAGLADALADAAAALADSAATIETLRRELGALSHHATEVSLAADTLQRRLDTLVATQAVERAAFEHFAALADSTILAQQQAIALLNRPCRVLGLLPCPSRPASFLAGAATAAAFAVLIL